VEADKGEIRVVVSGKGGESVLYVINRRSALLTLYSICDNSGKQLVSIKTNNLRGTFEVVLGSSNQAIMEIKKPGGVYMFTPTPYTPQHLNVGTLTGSVRKDRAFILLREQPELKEEVASVKWGRQAFMHVSPKENMLLMTVCAVFIGLDMYVDLC